MKLEETPVGRFVRHFREAQARINQNVKDQLYIKIYSSQMAAMRRQAYEDQCLYIADRTLPIEERMDYLIQLWYMCATFFDAGDVSKAARLIRLGNEYIGLRWAPMRDYLIGEDEDGTGPTRKEREEVVRYLAEADVIPRLMTACALSFKARDNDHNWTTAIQAPPMMPQATPGTHLFDGE